jgi:DNA-binding response OmpR family regulator
MSGFQLSVLLVEDEVVLAETILISIRKMGYDCDWAKNLREARQKLKNSSPDFIVLDRNLPDGDGVEILNLPERKHAMVLILSSKSSVEERVKGLQAGADDYLPKPFSFQELSARLQALERRQRVFYPATESKNENELWAMNRDQMTVLSPQGLVTLTPLEYKFLSYLIDRKNSIVSKDRLLKDVWGFSLLPKTRTVDYLITQLRKRIEGAPESPQHLLTVRGAGVKFAP